MTKAVIYTRLSLDRDGDKASPETQEAEARELCVSRGWEVVGVYSDRNLSAFKRGVRRPEFERCLADLAAGAADMLVAYKLDRITRGGVSGVSELLAKLDAAEAGLTCVHGDVDTSTEMGKAVLVLLGSVARQESLNTSLRVASAHRRAASRGEMHSGGPRQFGYERGGEIRDDEAVVVREVVGRLLAGEALNSVTIDLDGRGVRTTQGKRFRSDTLRQMITSPRLAGLRQYHGDLLPGNWEPIITPDERARLLGELDSRRNNGTGRAVRAHLLTGILKCGRCGANLKGTHFRMGNGEVFDRYQCLPRPGTDNCGGLAASKISVDRHVVGKWLDFMSRASLRPVDDEPDVKSEVDEVQARLLEISRARYVEGLLDEGTFLQLHSELSARLAGLRETQQAREVARAQVASALRPGSREDMEVWWERASLEDRRLALRRAFPRIELMPAAHRGGNVFDVSRVRIFPDISSSVYRLGSAAYELGLLPELTDQEVAAVQATALSTAVESGFQRDDPEKWRDG